jgi:putative ABC transport system permease protein
MALSTTVFATLAPALYAFRLNANKGLKAERGSFATNKHRSLARGALIVAEVALASGLSLVTGLLIKSFYQLKKVDLGFNPHHVFSFQITPPLNRYKEPYQRVALYKAGFDKLTSLPGMGSVGAISSLPLTSQVLANSMDVGPESPMFRQQLLVEHESILPGFFGVMRIPLLQGRVFTDADRQGTPPVIIVDDVLAAKLWPGQTPLGKRLHLSLIIGGETPWREVVGVVREIKHFGPERQVKWMQVYVPQFQDPSSVLSFVINTPLSDDAARKTTEIALHEIDKDLPVENFETLDGYLNRNYLSGRQVTLLLLTTFAGIGIALGLIGIYGVVANSVRQRRREIAIRMALGATPRSATFLVTRLSIFAATAGILIGSVIVMSLTRVLTSLLYGVTALDPAVYLVSAILLIVLTLTASVLPALRLFRFNIQEILRQS